MKAKIIQNENVQTIMIPNNFNLSASEYIIQKCGECLFLTPSDDPWVVLKHVIGNIEEDLSFDRCQPSL